jgi:glycosyltransferase involved in cell wall biosynthesis
VKQPSEEDNAGVTPSRVGTRLALDGTQLAVGHGPARTLVHVMQTFRDRSDPLEPILLTTRGGSEHVGDSPCETMIVPDMPSTLWEQVGLPFYCRKMGAGVVYSHRACGPTWGPPTVLHFLDDPRLAASRGATATTPRERLKRIYQRMTVSRALHHARVVVVNTQAVAESLRDRYGATLPIAIVPLGVDTDRFYPDSAEAQEDTVFHLGSWEPRDQTPTVVASYARSLMLAPDLPDLVVGGVLGDQLDLARKAAEGAGILNRVRFVGYLSDEDLRRSFAHAAVCVQPSHYEAFGLVSLEALACGAPLVVVPEPAVEEVVGAAALVVQNSDPESIARGIADLWLDKNKRSELRTRGPERAAEFSWTQTGEAIRHLLEKVAAS